jgi:hypothetical protein
LRRIFLSREEKELLMKSIRCLLGPALHSWTKVSPSALKQWIFVSAINECIELNKVCKITKNAFGKCILGLEYTFPLLF